MYDINSYAAIFLSLVFIFTYILHHYLFVIIAIAIAIVWEVVEYDDFVELDRTNLSRDLTTATVNYFRQSSRAAVCLGLDIIIFWRFNVNF